MPHSLLICSRMSVVVVVWLSTINFTLGSTQENKYNGLKSDEQQGYNGKVPDPVEMYQIYKIIIIMNKFKKYVTCKLSQIFDRALNKTHSVCYIFYVYIGLRNRLSGKSSALAKKEGSVIKYPNKSSASCPIRYSEEQFT